MHIKAIIQMQVNTHQQHIQHIHMNFLQNIHKLQEQHQQLRNWQPMVLQSTKQKYMQYRTKILLQLNE